MSDLPVVNSSSAVAAMLTGNKVAQTQGGGGAFIRFDAKRTGEWVFGMESEPVTGDVFSLDVASLKHGFHLWHAKKCDRRMVPLNADLPQPQEPVEWVDAKGKTQTDEAGEARYFEGSFDDGVKFHFEASTFGGRKAIDGILEELFSRAATGSAFLFPQVKLESNSYEHSSYGKVFEPVLTAVAWFDGDGNPEGEAPKQIAESAPEPADDAPVEEAPVKRRRRAS